MTEEQKRNKELQDTQAMTGIATEDFFVPLQTLIQ